jgi:hypothetical protein
MLLGVLGTTLGCGDKNTISGPAVPVQAPIAVPGATSPDSTRRSESTGSARTLLPLGGRPVSPTTVSPRTTDSPAAPPPEGLGGTWKGTIAFYANPEEGDVPCEKVASITIALIESGGNLTGQFEAGCHGTLVLHGIISGGQMFGSLDVSGAGLSYGRVYGSVSSNRIRFQTVYDLPGDGDEPDSDHDDKFVSSKADLSR